MGTPAPQQPSAAGGSIEASAQQVATTFRHGLGVDASPTVEIALAALAGAAPGSLPPPGGDDEEFAGRRLIAVRIAQARRASGDGRRAGVVVIEVVPSGTLGCRSHELGEVVEHRLASSLRRSGRDGGIADVVGRWDGDTYIALVAGLRDEDALTIVAKRLAAAVGRSPVTLPNGGHLQIRAAVGATLDDDADAPLEALVDRARAAAASGRVDGEVRLARGRVEESEALRIAQALALITSAREGVPALHCQQVADLSRAIARELGAPPDVVERAYLGGWLHDVGKVAIPDAIVGKPGRLTDEERNVMKLHSEIGDALVARISPVACSRRAVRNHHERWDGRGYPDGLEGEAIPLEARIVAIADSYSAITSERVYSAERSRAEAIVELRRSAGTHLDPAGVEALVRALDRIDVELHHLLRG